MSFIVLGGFMKIKKMISTCAIIFALGIFVACNQAADDDPPYQYTPVDDSDLEAMEALQFTQIMGNGINLGNTLEATATWIPYSNTDMTSYEKSWGQPVTTKEMFVAMKKNGFDSVRIPIAWTHTMDWSRGNFEINKEYFKRVDQVVGWALDAGLYVMINDHWDYQWWGLFGHDEELAFKIYDAIWTQVGEHYKDYDYRLIFEGGNEELGERFNDILIGCDESCTENHDTCGATDPRLDGTKIHYTEKGSLTENQQYEMILKVTQFFVNKIRSQGSKNEKRFLLIPGYNTDIAKTCDTRYKMPEDPKNSDVKKLLISVHYYEPALYAIADGPVDWGGTQQPATTWGTDEEVKKQNEKFEQMKKFVNQGYGVIIGEYGCAKLKDGNKRKDNMDKWITNILDNCDKYNYCPFLWDCNTFFKKDGGALGFREDPDLAELYQGRKK